MQNLNLNEAILRAVEQMGFKEASPIQAQTIPHIMEGRDIIGQAQTGTGKTAAFAIPLIEKVQPTNKRVQSLVLCPTRELAMQVGEEFKKLAKFMPSVRIISVYGGQPIGRQMRLLRQGHQIVVGTPGRIKDLIERGSLHLNSVQTVVLDEADEMLNMGFLPSIEHILQQTPKERQTVFFSATMPKAILKLTENYQRDALHLKVAQKEQSLVKIEQAYFEVRKKEKEWALFQLLEQNDFRLSIVFCNTKWKVDALTKRLKIAGYSAEGLHGGMTQSQRNRIMDGFRRGKIQMLVATDVAARGLHVNNVEAVFNFDMPKETEFYIHRIGRTGRAGMSGKAFTFVEDTEIRQLREIRKYPNVVLSKQELPA